MPTAQPNATTQRTHMPTIDPETRAAANQRAREHLYDLSVHTERQLTFRLIAHLASGGTLDDFPRPDVMAAIRQTFAA